MAFKTVTRIEHDDKSFAAGSEIKKSDIGDDKAWAELIAAGAISGATADELKEASEAAADADARASAAFVTQRTEQLDVREAQLDAREKALDEELEQLKADQQALETERKAFESTAKELEPAKKDTK